ncbi:MAG: T9SS type A sorting domain-containing protein [Bacteroidales bacterium]|nr:T9SS type A sorting domain-containing protein [Bacteroidales bacterium]
MKKFALLLGLFILFGYAFPQSKTLEVNPAAGDVFTGSDITLTWTIGEGVIETFSNNEMVLTQGFQQPSLKITVVEESDKIDFQINVYPNPTKDFLTINLVSKNDISCTTELFDMSGKLLFSKIFKGREITENIDLTNYSSNLYILRIIDNRGKLVRTYKVQKIK